MTNDEVHDFMELLKDYLANGTPHQKVKIVRWMVKFITGGK